MLDFEHHTDETVNMSCVLDKTWHLHQSMTKYNPIFLKTCILGYLRIWYPVGNKSGLKGKPICVTFLLLDCTPNEAS